MLFAPSLMLMGIGYYLNIPFIQWIGAVLMAVHLFSWIGSMGIGLGFGIFNIFISPLIRVLIIVFAMLSGPFTLISWIVQKIWGLITPSVHKERNTKEANLFVINNNHYSLHNISLQRLTMFGANTPYSTQKNIQRWLKRHEDDLKIIRHTNGHKPSISLMYKNYDVNLTLIYYGVVICAPDADIEQKRAQNDAQTHCRGVWGIDGAKSVNLDKIF